jgi:hypothetical protein
LSLPDSILTPGLGFGELDWAEFPEFPESVVFAAFDGAGVVAAFEVGVGIIRPVADVGWIVSVAEVAGAGVVGVWRVRWSGLAVWTKGAAMYRCGVTFWTSIGC